MIKSSRFTEGERDNKTIQNLIAVSIILLVPGIFSEHYSKWPICIIQRVSAMIFDLLGA